MSQRKSPERRQGKAGTTRDVGDVVDIKPGVSRAPAAPHWPRQRLLAETVHLWETFWASGLARLVEEPDVPAVRRLFRMYDERERMDRIFAKSPFVEGSTGQVVAHPAARLIASLDERIAKLEPRFGLTPKGRMDLGIAFGAAAKSLEDLNQEFDDDEGAAEVEGYDVDPRVGTIDV